MDQALEIIESLTRIQERADTFHHAREDIFEGLNLAEVHCIDWLGTLAYANVTKVAREMGITRGAVSKISRKLRNKGFVESYQRPDNNKEIYYRLTGKGQGVYREHQKCHARAREEKLSLLKLYTADEQSIILRFLTAVNQGYERRLAEESLDGK